MYVLRAYINHLFLKSFYGKDNQKNNLSFYITYIFGVGFPWKK